MGSAAVTERVLALLEAEPTTSGVFTNDNVCLSGTHTHSAPAGRFLFFLLYHGIQYRHSEENISSFSDPLSVSMTHFFTFFDIFSDDDLRNIDDDDWFMAAGYQT